MWEKLIFAHKSLINVLNKKSPKVKPCGTADSMGKVEEDFPKMRTTEKPDNY
jgi:hypothetical protein